MLAVTFTIPDFWLGFVLGVLGSFGVMVLIAIYFGNRKDV